MTTEATLRPGQNGTKRLTDKSGKRLVCVRYKYDKAKRYEDIAALGVESRVVANDDPPSEA